MTNQINLALQQFTGFKMGKWETITDLVHAMGLSEKEWDYIKKYEDKALLNNQEVKEIDEYFEELTRSEVKK